MSKTLNFEQKVIAIQSELKAPKSQYNSFGKYRYRNQEDILEAVKPLLSKYELSITLTDTINETPSGICYVEARAILHGTDGKIESVAQAGIDINKKGMDISQSFGSSSSYARKYALNGLLLIDDTKDADSTNNHATSSLKWLNEGTPEFNKAIAHIKKGGKILDIKKKFNISKTVETKLTNIKS